jgi:hypothetical protein
MNLLKQSWILLLPLLIIACDENGSITSNAGGPGSDSTIAFLCDGQLAQICVMKADGSDFKKLTAGGGPKGPPAINRVGQIVFRCGWRDEQLCVVMDDGTGFQRLSNTREHPESPQNYVGVPFLRDANPSINDDGLIAFSCFDGEDREICVINFDDSGFKMLTKNSNIEDWNPAINNAGQIAYSCNSAWQGVLPSVDNLCVINADGSGQKQLTTLYWKNSDPVINESGQIAFVCYTPEPDNAPPGAYTFESEICLVNFDNTLLKRLTDNELTDWEPALNDKNQIVYECTVWDGATLKIEICMVDSVSEEFTRLTSNNTSDDAPTINNAGLIIYQCGESGQSQICSIQPDATDFALLTKESFYLTNPAMR